tara:strand:- start:7509 stop:7964 length:456 start_codon:yes stop_codon:yes gene_type:complete
MINAALNDYLKDFDLMSYRLLDGSHIIANEDHYDNDAKSFYVTRPVEIKVDNEGRCFLLPWLMTEGEDLVPIANQNIISFAQPSKNIQIQYHRYILKTELYGVLTEKEINVALNQLFNHELDNQDTIDNMDYQDLPPRSLKWRLQQKPYHN